MDPAITNRLVEKARSYGLHSCHYCRAFLIDFTPLYENDDNPGRLIVDKGGRGTWDGSVSSVIKFCKFHFSKEIMEEAQLECPLFDKQELFGSSIFTYFSIDPDPINCNIRRLYIRLPKDISSLVSELETPGLPIHPCIRSDKVFSRARDLLAECLKEHHKCNRAGSAPSRLLDVTVGRTRLVNTKFIKDPVWAALSYCWGGPQNSQTTSFNLQDRYREVPLEDLPLTIRDAVYVCRQMDIQYLWIDSICIIQEEINNNGQTGGSDKDGEIRKMAGIFSGAILTIAASCASSANEGFLQDRQPYVPGVGIPVRINDNYDMAQLVGNDVPLSGPPTTEPIDGRAWTFQEQLLSSRMLSFTKHAMQWHCQSQDCCIFQEGYHFLSKPSKTLVAYGKGTWAGLVSEYCQRDLSNLEDRPIAIAAVAETFAKNNPNITASDYVASLWKTNILDELMWSPEILGYRNETLPKLQGPSWSWTSIPGKIKFNTRASRDVFEPTASLVSVDIDLADPQFIFGAVKSGRLRFRGTISHHHTGRVLQSDLKWSPIYKGCPRLFIDRREATLKEVFLLELGIVRSKKMPSQSVGIALQSTGKLGQFVRVGTYTESCFKLSHGYCMICQEKGPEGSIIEII